MWEGHTGQIQIARYRIAFTSPDTRPTSSAPYRLVPEAWELEKTEMYKMLSERHRASTIGMGLPVMFVLKKVESLLFCRLWQIKCSYRQRCLSNPLNERMQ